MIQRLVTVLVFLCMATPGLAQETYKRDPLVSELTEGMTFNEVLQAWGTPAEKIEQESRRIDVWVYSDSRVRFHEGKVIGVENASLAAPQQKGSNAARTKTAATAGTSDIKVEDILNEIMDASEN